MSEAPLPARRGRLSDAASIGLALVYGAAMVTVGDASGEHPGIPTPLDVGIGVACAVPLVRRRQHPVAVAIGLIPFGAVSVMATGPILAAVFGVAARRGARTAVPVGLVHVATAPLYYLLQPAPTYPLWVDLVVRPLVTAAAVGWGLFAGARRQVLASLRERAERAEAEQHQRAERARQAERTRIAREMHDVLAHRLSLVSLHAGALEVRTDATCEEVTAAAAVIRSNAHLALEELRQVIGVLRGSTGAPSDPSLDPLLDPPADPPQPGLGDLPDLVRSARAAGVTITYSTEVDAARVPAGLGRTVYRLVQEGLTNARKHAPGSPVEVTVTGEPGAGLRVGVVNALAEPGRPVDVPGARLGLIGLAERIALAGGRLEHGTDPGSATFRLESWLPWASGVPGAGRSDPT